MKNIPFVAALIIFQAIAVSAQESNALAQLAAMPAAELSAAAPAPLAQKAELLRAKKAVKTAEIQRAKNPSDNKEETAGEPARKMWAALDLMTKLEQVALHVIDGGTDSLLVESLTCSEDNYAACSMFVTLNSQRKLVVTVDAGAKIIEALAENGFYQEEENWTVYVKSAHCRKTGEEYACSFIP